MKGIAVIATGRLPHERSRGRTQKLAPEARTARRVWRPDLQRLAQISQIREYARGQVIVGPDPKPDLIYVVLGGRVKLSTYVPDGRAQVLALLEPGALFGEFAPGEPSVPVWAEAFDHVVIGVVHRSLLEDILRSAPEIGMQVIRALAHRLRAAEQEIHDLALWDIRGRLASLLARLAEVYGEPHDRGIRLSLRLTHRDLASMIGTTRETTTSLISRFRDEGLLAVERRMLIIVALDRLRALAQHGRH